MAFDINTKRRLLELAGMAPPAISGLDSDAGLHGEHPDAVDSSEEPTEEHLEKETSVFQKMHDALEELLDFLQSQEGFEEKRGKESEYSEMEHDAKELMHKMKEHLSEYNPEDEDGEEDHSDHEEAPEM